MRRLLLALVLALVVSAAAVTSASSNNQPDVRFATFNASLNRSAAGLLVEHLSNPAVDDVFRRQARNVAEVVQRVRPDVLLINEFDFDPAAVGLFHDNFLQVSHNGSAPIKYRYSFIAPSNTGIPTGKDLDNNGMIGGGNDAFGFGAFPGQFGMVVYSKYPIATDDVRTFQLFRWKDMPGNLIPTPFYSPDEVDILRLSSKSHWDIPIRIGKKTVHFLVSHPTPPVFDGPEDRNGRRNFDEIRLLGRLHLARQVGLHLRRQGAVRRAEAGRALRHRRRPELRSSRRGQHPGLDPAAAGASARQCQDDTRERRSDRGSGAPGRCQPHPQGRSAL